MAWINLSGLTLGPASPGVPVGPMGPIGPGGPFSPGEPTSPGIPCLPSCPGRPSAPDGPGGPGGPGSPGSPCYVPRALRRYGFSLRREPSTQECLSVLVGLCHGLTGDRQGEEREDGGSKKKESRICGVRSLW